MQPLNPKWFLLTLIAANALLAGFSIDLYAPSLPAIATYFHAPASYTQLALAIYLLGMGIGQPIFGTLSDCFGRRYQLITGTFIYVIATGIAAFSNSIYLLIAMRLLQGLGASACSVVNKAMMTDSFSTEELPKYASFMTICWGIGPIIAPLIGGYLQHYFGWRSNFLWQTVHAFFILLLAIFVLKETNRHLHQFDMKSIKSTYLTIMQHKLFIGSILCMAAMYSLIIVFNIMSPFLIQNELNYSVLAYSRIALIIGIAYFAGAVVNRILLTYFSLDKLLSIGIYTSFVVSVLMIIFVFLIPMNLWLITIPSFLLFLLGGLVFPNGMAKGMLLFREAAGAANAVMGSIFLILTFIMSYITSFLSVNSVLPMAFMYLLLTVIYLIIKFSLLQFNKY